MLICSAPVIAKAGNFSWDDWNHVLLGNNPFDSDLTQYSHWPVGSLTAYGTVKLADKYLPYWEWYAMFMLQVAVSFVVGASIELTDMNYDWGDVKDYGAAGTILAGIIIVVRTIERY